jgi:hypothetical protein
MAGMHWWPMLLVVISYPLLFVTFLLGIMSPVFGILFMFVILGVLACGVAFAVFWFIWHWKIFEKVGGEGWWILLTLVPYAGGVLYMVFLGIAAWGKPKE